MPDFICGLLHRICSSWVLFLVILLTLSCHLLNASVSLLFPVLTNLWDIESWTTSYVLNGRGKERELTFIKYYIGYFLYCVSFSLPTSLWIRCQCVFLHRRKLRLRELYELLSLIVNQAWHACPKAGLLDSTDCVFSSIMLLTLKHTELLIKKESLYGSKLKNQRNVCVGRWWLVWCGSFADSLFLRALWNSLLQCC